MISGPAMVTFPLDTGATRAASIRPSLAPVGAILVPVAYSASGQSEGNWDSAEMAALVKLARIDYGIFSKAIMPLREL